MKLIDLNEIIDKISVLYREEQATLTDMNNEMMRLRIELKEARDDEYKHITVARRNDIRSRLDELYMLTAACEQRAAGIHDVREMLLNMLEEE